MRWLAWFGFGVAGLCLVGAAFVGIFGYVVVHDDTGAVASAVVTNDRAEQALWRLPGGLFFGVPRMEGTVEVRCRNGARTRWGYVTGHMTTSVRVVGAVPCGRMVDG